MSVELVKPLTLSFMCVALALVVGFGTAQAQVLIANDDSFGIPLGGPLIVEAFGVLDNDLLDDENAGENGATAELVTDVSHGTLVLALDGSFTYSPGGTFDGTDSFVYRAVFGSVTDQATVALSACSGGPLVFDCWNETTFLAKAAELGYFSFQEGFENDAVWGIARSPNTAPSVSSQGIRWRSNHPDPPASNEITTGSGPARTGQWGVFDPDHGYATGTPVECDIDNPPLHCLYYDGFTGVREPSGSTLYGVGGYITGIHGANVGILLDGAAPIGGGRVFNAFQFLGVIQTAGFAQFEFRELDGKIGQALFIWADDFTLLTTEQTSVEQAVGEPAVFFAGATPNPTGGNTALRFSLPAGASAQLSIYDLPGRLVREVGSGIRGEGEHAVTWDARDAHGRRVSTGIYFVRMVVTRGAVKDVRVKKIVVTP